MYFFFKSNFFHFQKKKTSVGWSSRCKFFWNGLDPTLVIFLTKKITTTGSSPNFLSPNSNGQGYDQPWIQLKCYIIRMWILGMSWKSVTMQLCNTHWQVKITYLLNPHFCGNIFNVFNQDDIFVCISKLIPVPFENFQVCHLREGC